MDILYDAPWWLCLAIVTAGAALFVSGNRRRQSTTMRAGAAIAVAGIAVALLSYFVDTDVEIARNRTRQLVRAVIARDATTLRNLLHANASFQVRGRSTAEYADGATLAAGATAAAELYHVESGTVVSMDAQQADSLITIRMTVWSTQQATLDRPMRTDWQLEWQKTADGWKLFRIELLQIGQQQAGDLNVRFPR